MPRDKDTFIVIRDILSFRVQSGTFMINKKQLRLYVSFENEFCFVCCHIYTTINFKKYINS